MDQVVEAVRVRLAGVPPLEIQVVAVAQVLPLALRGHLLAGLVAVVEVHLVLVQRRGLQLMEAAMEERLELMVLMVPQILVAAVAVLESFWHLAERAALAVQASLLSKSPTRLLRHFLVV
jgi:hypothetical protein